MNCLKRILLALLALIVFSSLSYGVENEPSRSPSPSHRREGTNAPTLSAEPPSTSPDATRRRSNDTAIDLVSDSSTDDERESFGSGLGGGGGDDDGGNDPRPSFGRRWVFRPKPAKLDEPLIWTTMHMSSLRP